MFKLNIKQLFRSLLVLLSFILLAIALSVLPLWLLIAPLVSSSFSYNVDLYHNKSILENLCKHSMYTLQLMHPTKEDIEHISIQ